MGPKVNCNPVKLTTIVTYLQKSRTAHSIKDLEKHIPSIASINGMVVKDYIQALTDENRINVEKIGSGNWYWSFASQDLRVREQALANAHSAHEKASAVVDELQQKLADVRAQREDEEAALDDPSELRREDLLAKQAQLEQNIKDLAKELEAYKDNDPTELERKVKEAKEFQGMADVVTDEIYSMEGWFKKQGQDAEGMKALRMMFYGDELDEETGMLKELA